MFKHSELSTKDIYLNPFVLVLFVFFVSYHLSFPAIAQKLTSRFVYSCTRKANCLSADITKPLPHTREYVCNGEPGIASRHKYKNSVLLTWDGSFFKSLAAQLGCFDAGLRLRIIPTSATDIPSPSTCELDRDGMCPDCRRTGTRVWSGNRVAQQKPKKNRLYKDDKSTSLHVMWQTWSEWLRYSRRCFIVDDFVRLPRDDF